MSVLRQIAVEMTDMLCGKCGVAFSMPESVYKDRHQNGDTFYCPNGHPRVFREPDVERLKKQLDAATRTNTELAERVREAQALATKAAGERDRLLKRSRAGVCPCCNRSFTNLRRHMATKHKESPQ